MDYFKSNTFFAREQERSRDQTTMQHLY
jgi:CRP-like cAMP-binding protein